LNVGLAISLASDWEMPRLPKSLHSAAPRKKGWANQTMEGYSREAQAKTAERQKLQLGLLRPPKRTATNKSYLGHHLGTFDVVPAPDKALPYPRDPLPKQAK
jgi:hypothetical protein